MNKEGLKDWKNANHLLMVHEQSQGHNANITTWKYMEVHLAKGLRTERQEMALVEAERTR